MKLLFTVFTGLVMSLSINVFASGITDKALEKQNNGEDDAANVRILREYSDNQNDTNKDSLQPVSEIDQHNPLDGNSSYDATVAPAEEIIKEYSNSKDDSDLDSKQMIDTKSQHDENPHNTSENKLPGGCKNVAEEAKPKHALDSNIQ